MIWELSHRADPKARTIADRHYNRQSVGADNFVPPGRCVVLWTPGALWVSSWPFAEYVKHAWAGAWMCTAFRNEGAGLSSDLVAATRWMWGECPALGFVTFVDRSKTRPKKHPGFCYRQAGWTEVGKTKGGLVALQLKPQDFPPPEQPRGVQAWLPSLGVHRLPEAQ